VGHVADNGDFTPERVFEGQGVQGSRHFRLLGCVPPTGHSPSVQPLYRE
jgi:hypothetical protein